MFAPLGVAHVENGGFRVSGRYPFGSGSGHADYMGGSAMVMQDGEMAPFVDGLPQIRAFIVPSDRAALKGNWNVMGLRGTGSFDFEIPEQHVEAGQTFSLFETHPITGGAIYGLGPVVLGTISSVAWAIGVARRALHEIAEIAKGGRTRLGSLPLREQPIFQRDFGLHTTAVAGARALARDSYGGAVAALERGESKQTCSDLIRETKAAASYVTKLAVEATTFAWQASGSLGMRNPSRLQRCFRDMYMGAGHQVFDERNYNELAKANLDLETAIF
jgi:alkylation response protein AidB-like acyl-CoA dehydrogenase